MQHLGAEIVPRFTFETRDNAHWAYLDGILTITELTGGAHVILNIEDQNFVLEAKVRIDQVNRGEGAPITGSEAKFVYSDADIGENFRLDLMEKMSLARLSLDNVLFPAALFHVSVGVEYQVKIIVKDFFVTVSVDGLETHHRISFGKRGNGWIGFGAYWAKVSFRDIHFRKLIQREIFVAIQYDGKRDFLYEVIKKCLDDKPEFDFRFTREDERLGAGRITDDMKNDIEKADLVIADISEDNRNVYYEIGLAHGIASKNGGTRSVLILKERMEGKPLDLPFDIKDFRTQVYKFTPKEFEALKTVLARAILDSLGLS